MFQVRSGTAIVAWAS